MVFLSPSPLSASDWRALETHDAQTPWPAWSGCVMIALANRSSLGDARAGRTDRPSINHSSWGSARIWKQRSRSLHGSSLQAHSCVRKHIPPTRHSVMPVGVSLRSQRPFPVPSRHIPAEQRRAVTRACRGHPDPSLAHCVVYLVARQLGSTSEEQGSPHSDTRQAAHLVHKSDEKTYSVSFVSIQLICSP